MTEWERADQARNVIISKSTMKPKIAIILGTGLGKLVDRIDVKFSIPYEEIPFFPVSTMKGHSGHLILGTLAGKEILAFSGRFHLYEGYSVSEIALPIRLLKLLGIKVLIESNAAGGLNPLYRVGDLVAIEDHINLMGENPLIGANDERFGERIPDFSDPYDRNLLDLAERTALNEGIMLKRGVLVGLTGPSLETRAEYRFLRIIGADMVCMSTIPEVIAAVHQGIKVLGVSVISDMCLPDALEPASFEKILGAASSAEPILTKLMEKIILSLQLT